MTHNDEKKSTARKPGEFAGYQVKALKQTASGAFTANLYRNGKHVLYVENSGRGGCNLYHPAQSGNGEQTLLEEFAQRVYPNGFEAADQFVAFLIMAGDIERQIERKKLDRAKAIEQVIADERAYYASAGWTPDDMEREFEFLRQPELLNQFAA
jgi:hypothetical protein